MELRNNTCSLCGQTIGDAESTWEQVLDNTRYSFDTVSCLAMFKRFQDVYGKSFVTQLAVKS